ncbi:hypothetical protein [Desulfuribacillus alkaliarsenatis]|uniref:Uncharacterized protein n=1 Tax=Desulfuribacillus alkaliarsenatis TaxID=766136 RepID=A0A1E5FZK9_9FIRM|nr:hypothetical protein [Desulfuribacillus alkaliarsenatis]OEF95888.1 hypothetical protein BHF68_10880 [Desulfuribacillus alkaliarsenatis]
MGLGLMLAIMTFVSFIVNLPMGMWRVKVPKFSWQWFVAIHLSVPLIFFLRTEANISYLYIPLFVTAAIIGQLVGGKILLHYSKAYKLKKTQLKDG